MKKKIKLGKAAADETIEESAESMVVSEGESVTAKPKNQKWKKVLEEYGYLGFAFIIPIALMYLLYIAMEIHPFGNGSVLVLDLNAQYVHFYEALRAWIHGDGSLLYSFGRSLGGEFMGIYAYYIASPFSYIVGLFPINRMLEALLTIFLLKAGCCGATFAFYLHKTAPKRNKIAIITISIMYAMCAYCVVQQHNSMWIDAVIWLPLLTYGIEELIKKGHFRLFVVSLAVTMMSNFYIGYMVCLYTLVYFFYYYLKTNVDHINNPYREKKHFLKSFIRIGVYSVIALGAATVIWLSAYYALSFGKNEFTNPSWGFKANFSLLEMLTKLLPGSFDTVRPEGLPFIYCGTMALFLIPLYFLSKKFSFRDKVFSAIFIGFFVASFSINPADLIWHGFQNPNWLNYRYSFMLCFVMLVLAYHAICELNSVKPQWLFAIGCSIGLFAVVMEQFNFESYVKAEGKLDPFQFVWFALIAAMIYAVILAMICRAKNREAKKRSLSIILLFVVCIEMTLNGLTNVFALDRDVVYSTYSSYNVFMGDLRPVIDEIQAKDTSFYRSEKTDIRRPNDNMGLKIRGLSNSTSTLNASTIQFLNQMGYASSSHWSKYFGGNPVNDSLLGIKYIYDFNQHVHETEEAYNRTLMETHYITEIEGLINSAFQNPYALSLAYGVDYAINGINMENYFNPYERLNDLITAMLGADEEIQVFEPVPDVTTSTTNCETSSIAKHTKYEPEVSSRDAVLHYSFSCEEDSTLYFYLPSEYPREVAMKVNSIDYDTFYGNNTSRSRLIGEYKAGDSILVSLTLKKENLYVKKNVPVIYRLNWEVFESAMAELSKTQFMIDAEYSETNLPGTITTLKNDQTILVTVPYDKGWIVTVDGEQVETYETLDALIAFEIQNAGEHELVLKYRPKTFVYGMYATVFFSVLFLGICWISHFMNKKNKKFFLLTGVAVRDESEWADEADALSPEDIADMKALAALEDDMHQDSNSEQERK